MTTPAKLNNIQQRSDMCLRLYDLYKKKACCDITLCITNPEACDEIYSIECHKVMLIAASHYFEGVLLADEGFSDTNLLEVGKGSVDVIKEVLSFIYSGQCEVTSGNLVELFRYSVKWQLKNLEQLLSDVFVEYLTLDNAVEAFELVTQGEKQALISEASIYIRKHFDSLANAESFNRMSLVCLSSILKHDEIKTSSEDTILRAVLSWVEHNVRDDLELDQLWKLVRFEHLTPQYLLHELENPIMSNQPQRDLVRNTLAILCAAENIPKTITQRYWGTKPVDNKLAKITTDKKICVFDDETKEWSQIGEVPDWVDKCTQCYVYGSMLLLLGAYKKEHRVNITLIDLNRPMLVTPIPNIDGENRYNTGLIQVDNVIYTIGGRCSDNNSDVTNMVAKLDMEISTNSWQEIEPLLEHVRNPLVFTHNDLIFVIGGVNNDNVVAIFNQVYDTKLSKWELKAEAPECCYTWQHGGFILNNYIHIYTSTHHLTYSIDTDSWTSKQYCKVSYHIQPVMHGDQVLACVRSTSIELDEQSDFVCKSYDEEKNEWKDVEDIDLKDCLMHNKFFTFKK